MLISFLHPARAREWPENSPQKALARLALRQLWHQIFDPCPRLLTQFAPNGAPLMEGFLAYAESRNLPMDWRTHLEILYWLPRASVGEELARELLAAAACRWAIQDLSPALGILLRSDYRRGTVVGAWKSTSARERRRVFEGQTSEFAGEGAFCARLFGLTIPETLPWEDVREPRYER